MARIWHARRAVLGEAKLTAPAHWRRSLHLPLAVTTLAIAPKTGTGYGSAVMTGVDRAIRVSTAIAVRAVADVAAYVSFWHAYAVVCAHGETGITARLEPVTIDGLVYASSAVQIVCKVARWSALARLRCRIAVADRHCGVQPLPVFAAGDHRDPGVHGGALGGVGRGVVAGSRRTVSRKAASASADHRDDHGQPAASSHQGHAAVGLTMMI